LRARADRGAGVVVITHDIGSVARVADRIVVLHAGRSVEDVDVSAFLGASPAHPYSAALKAALPGEGFAPATLSRPAPDRVGCLHAADCALASALCRREAPGWRATALGRVRCHHAPRA
jgi:ABC-type dipeptide/oligopeptide/nickel transport system ATPase component